MAEMVTLNSMPSVLLRIHTNHLPSAFDGFVLVGLPMVTITISHVFP